MDGVTCLEREGRKEGRLKTRGSLPLVVVPLHDPRPFCWSGSPRSKDLLHLLSSPLVQLIKEVQRRDETRDVSFESKK